MKRTTRHIAIVHELEQYDYFYTRYTYAKENALEYLRRTYPHLTMTNVEKAIEIVDNKIKAIAPCGTIYDHASIVKILHTY